MKKLNNYYSHVLSQILEQIQHCEEGLITTPECFFKIMEVMGENQQLMTTLYYLDGETVALENKYLDLLQKHGF